MKTSPEVSPVSCSLGTSQEDLQTPLSLVCCFKSWNMLELHTFIHLSLSYCIISSLFRQSKSSFLMSTTGIAALWLAENSENTIYTTWSLECRQDYSPSDSVLIYIINWLTPVHSVLTAVMQEIITFNCSHKKLNFWFARNQNTNKSRIETTSGFKISPKQLNLV